MVWLYEIVVWIHVLAAITWIGGMAFFVLVLVPTLRRPELRERSAELLRRSGTRFRAVGWICLGTLVVTGSLNMWFRGLRWSFFFDSQLRSNPVVRALGLKLLLVALVLLLSAVHDFYVGPRAVEALEAEPTSTRAARLRRLASSFGRLNALLAMGIVFLAVLLVRGGL